MATKIWARVVNGAVAEVMPPLDAGLVPGKHVFTQAFAQTLVDVTSITGISDGWVESNGTFAAPAPAAPMTVPQLLTSAQRAFQAALKKAQTFNVAASGQPAMPILCDGTRATIDDLAELADYGKANASATRIWLDNAGKSTMLTGAQLVTLDALVRAWRSATYTAHAILLAGIAAAPPTITTTAQVSAFAWPTS